MISQEQPHIEDSRKVGDRGFLKLFDYVLKQNVTSIKQMAALSLVRG
jgi:hypothetical protein